MYSSEVKSNLQLIKRRTLICENNLSKSLSLYIKYNQSFANFLELFELFCKYVFNKITIKIKK